MPWSATIYAAVAAKTLLSMAHGMRLLSEILATEQSPDLTAKRSILSTVRSDEGVVLADPQEGILDDCDISEYE